jgi:hypothetical protein
MTKKTSLEQMFSATQERRRKRVENLQVSQKLLYGTRQGIIKLLRSPAIVSKETTPAAYVTCAGIFKLLRSPGIDSKESVQPAYVAWRPYSFSVPSLHRLFHNYSTVLEFLNYLWGAKNRVGTGLSSRPARLHKLAESIPWK